MTIALAVVVAVVGVWKMQFSFDELVNCRVCEGI